MSAIILVTINLTTSVSIGLAETKEEYFTVNSDESQSFAGLVQQAEDLVKESIAREFQEQSGIDRSYSYQLQPIAADKEFRFCDREYRAASGKKIRESNSGLDILPMLNCCWDSETAIFRLQILGDRQRLMYLRPVGLHPDKTIRVIEMIEKLIIGNGESGIVNK